MNKCIICNKNPKYGKTSYCRDCHNALNRRIRQEKKLGTYVSKKNKPRLTDDDRTRRKQEMIEYQKRYRATYAEAIAKHKVEYANRVKQEGISAYGDRCTCCGESNYGFLTLEHLDGRKDEIGRKRTGKQAWMRLKSLGYPKDKYTLLCFNCNCGKAANGGICPHQQRK